MVDDRLERIEGKLDGLIQGHAELRAGQEDLRREVRAGQEDLRREVRAGQEDLRREMRAGQEDLRHEMRLLHEDTIDKIKALAPDFGPIRREFTDADDRLRENIDRRLTPLEAWVKTRGTDRS